MSRAKKKNNQATVKPSKNTHYPDDLVRPNYLDTPREPIEVKKPINGYDYLSALVRIPEVQKDMKVMIGTTDKEKRNELLYKYRGIKYPLELLQKPTTFHRYSKWYLHSGAVYFLSNWQKDNLNSLSQYRDGKHVVLAVDVTKKDSAIMKEVGKLLGRIKKDYERPKDATKDKDTVEDIWKVYDYKTKDRLNFTQIARKLSGEKGNPTYNAKLKARLESVKRAYKKAKKIINTVEQEVKETIIANAERKKAEDETKEMLKRMLEESGKKEKTPSIFERLFPTHKGGNE